MPFQSVTCTSRCRQRAGRHGVPSRLLPGVAYSVYAVLCFTACRVAARRFRAQWQGCAGTPGALHMQHGLWYNSRRGSGATLLIDVRPGGYAHVLLLYTLSLAYKQTTTFHCCGPLPRWLGLALGRTAADRPRLYGGAAVMPTSPPPLDLFYPDCQLLRVGCTLCLGHPHARAGLALAAGCRRPATGQCAAAGCRKSRMETGLSRY